MKNRFRLNLALGFGLISSVSFGQQPQNQVEPAQMIQKEIKMEEIKTEEVKPEKKEEASMTQSEAPQKEVLNQEKTPETAKKPLPIPVKTTPTKKQKAINSTKEEKPKHTPPAKPIAPKE